MKVALDDPEVCRHCHVRGIVIESRRRTGYRRRRHECPICRHRWNSWQTRIDPRRLRPVRRPGVG